MVSNENSDIPAGWTGGFAESNPEFAYPDPNLKSLFMWGNLDNLDKLKRQQKVIWPEFSWETDKGDEATRCFQMFSPDISRVGYDNRGRVWSIICPQQGTCFYEKVCINVEITVTRQRGWVNEDTRELAADMGVEGKIWFSPSAHQHWFVRHLWDKFEEAALPFPSSKAQAIRVKTHQVDNPSNPYFPVRKGQSTQFSIPEFATHDDEAWTVGNIEVEIGDVVKTHHEAVDTFNQKIVDIFNLSAGNMLQSGNILTWNVWFTPPELVDEAEWADHAEKWRKSIDADHGSPTGPGRPPMDYNENPIDFGNDIDKESMLKDIIQLVESLL